MRQEVLRKRKKSLRLSVSVALRARCFSKRESKMQRTASAPYALTEAPKHRVMLRRNQKRKK